METPNTHWEPRLECDIDDHIEQYCFGQNGVSIKGWAWFPYLNENNTKINFKGFFDNDHATDINMPTLSRDDYLKVKSTIILSFLMKDSFCEAEQYPVLTGMKATP